jgi:hypothetical protein
MSICFTAAYVQPHSQLDSHRPDICKIIILNTTSGKETGGYLKKIIMHGKRMFDREKERRSWRRRRKGGAVHRTPFTAATGVEVNFRTITRSEIIRDDANRGEND